tara:strand:- start:29 stop:547 length:519 start_codon:yes stop_codon:yes gene_type:complete
MKTYKEFITKKEPVELDEAIPLALGGIALWKILAGGGLAATAYANRKRISQTFSNMFNRGETIDDLNKLDNFWRDNTKTNNDTKTDGIGTDVINPGALDTKDTTDTKTDTEVGAGTQTQTQTQTINPAIAGAKSMSIAKAETNAKRIKPFNFRKLPKLPGTGHNVGKRVNPQ